MSESEIRLTVPSGFRAGPYDAVVTNPGGAADVLHNGFLACERRELTCALEPLLDITPPGFERGPVSWWMTLEGDEVFFEPKVRHEGIVLLAELPTNLETRHEPGDGSGRMAIGLRIVPSSESGMVVLVGDDPAKVTGLWEEMLSEGSCARPRIDERADADVTLEVHRSAVRVGVPQRWPMGGAQGPNVTRGTAPVRYRYEFSGDGVLTAARAWGPDVDLVIAASAEGKYRCRYGKTISLFDVLQQECENYAAEHPELAPLCNR